MALAFDSHGSGPAARAPARHRQPPRHVGSRGRRPGARAPRHRGRPPGLRRLARTSTPSPTPRASRRTWSAGSPSRASTAPTSPATRWAAPSRSSSRAAAPWPRPPRSPPPASGPPRELRLRAALAARVARDRQAAAPRGARRSTRTAAGRVALFSQIYGRPWRLPPDDAVAAIDAFLDGPAFDAALEAVRPLPLRRGRRAARRAGDDRVGHARRAAHPAPGRARAAAAALGAARRAAGLRPRALSRRPGGRRGGAAGAEAASG